MSEYKKGFTLIEVLLVMVLIIALFSMSMTILNSFSNTNQKYLEKDLDEVRSILGQMKYAKLLGEKDVTYKCDDGKVSLIIDNKIIDEKQLKAITCDKDFKFLNGSSTFEVIINQHGYISLQRI